MSESTVEHHDDEPTTDPVLAPGEPVTDAPHVSEETGTRYDAVGQTETTPEDEELFRAEVDEA